MLDCKDVDYMIVSNDNSLFIENYVLWMIEVANDDMHGYSLINRRFRPDIDCSSFVFYALVKGAKVDKELLGNNPFTTHNMEDYLLKIGFKKYKYKKDELKRGDILWRVGHTEVYIGNGLKVGAHHNYDNLPGDSSGREVNIKKNNDNWMYYYRYMKKE